MEGWPDDLVDYPTSNVSPLIEETNYVNEDSRLDSSSLISAPNGRVHSVVCDFQSAIESDPHLYMLFHKMFTEIPKTPESEKDAFGRPTIRSYQEMLAMMNIMIRQAPEFEANNLMLGCPFNAMFAWPMATPSGRAIFLHPTVNTHLKGLLNEWARFLDSADSLYVLSKHPQRGWLGRDAFAAMECSFESTYVCDTEADHYGFKSWNDFFTRRLRPNAKPLASPEDDAVIVNACEASPWRLVHGVKERDQFWIKEQPYSLSHIMADDELVSKFIGGTIYQAYLESVSYHRWHSPVAGKVVKVKIVPGTYYAESAEEGYDREGPNRSQGYIAQLATRAVIFLQARNPQIGLICFVAIGIGDISSCQPTTYEGQHVTKGDELGTFQHGGSSYCLIIRPSVKAYFDLRGQIPGPQARKIPINEAIAIVSE